MPYYDIIGKGVKTNRTRHTRYLADDENHAQSLAEIDGTEVTSIEMVKTDLATAKQKVFARKIGLSFPDEININEISNLLDGKLDNDMPAPTWLLEYVWSVEPAQKGISFTRYVGRSKLVRFIYDKYFNDEHKSEMVRWFLYFVVRDRLNISWDTSIAEIDSKYSLEPIALKLLENTSVINSVKRYTELCLLQFGEYTDKEGYIVTGGSKRTISYREALSLLKNAGVISTKEVVTGIRGNNANSHQNETTGCLGIIVIFALIPFSIYAVW